VRHKKKTNKPITWTDRRDTRRRIATTKSGKKDGELGRPVRNKVPRGARTSGQTRPKQAKFGKNTHSYQTQDTSELKYP
jgi:hypothetical protein